MTDENPDALTVVQANAELAQLAQWWDQYQQMVQQVPQVQQRVAFLQGFLAGQNGHAPVTEVVDPVEPNRAARRAKAKP